MKKLSIFLCAMLLVFGVVGSADASIIVYNFTGTISDIEQDIQGIVPFTTGTAFTGSFSWDDEKTANYATSEEAYYNFTGSGFVHSFEWNIGGLVFKNTPGEYFGIVVQRTTDHVFDISFYNGTLPDGWSALGGNWESPIMQFNLRDNSSTVFDDTSLPQTLDISDFSSGQMLFLHLGNPSPTLVTPLGEVTSRPPTPYKGLDFRGTIETITVSSIPMPVPELVSIDIKPGRKCPNRHNINKREFLKVAILGTEDFDITAIDRASIRLEGVSPIRSRIRDVSRPVSDPQDECDCTEEGADGIDDLWLKFCTQEIVDAIGDVNHREQVVLTIKGELTDGTAIEGKDCLVIIDRH